MRDSVVVSIDWKESPAMIDTTPLVFICPGVASTRDTRTPLFYADAFLEKGWRSLVYTRRGHGGNSLLPTNGDLSKCQPYFTYCDINDLTDVIEHVVKQYPNAPKILVGISAGGNMVLKYIGEQKGKHPFLGAVCVSSGQDVVHVAKGIKSMPLMNGMMLEFLRKIFIQRIDDVRTIARARGVKLDFDRLLKTNDILEFDAKLMLPLFPQYKTVEDYYASFTWYDSIKYIDVPFLALSAIDDPLIHPKAVNCALKASLKNKHIISIETEKGGHLGCLESWSGKSWHEHIICMFIDNILHKNQRQILQ
jgi:predicted alpha/beta-fold hydrolase